MHWMLLFFCILSACNTKSQASFLAQGRAIKCELLTELEQINDIDQLLLELPQLERHFNHLVDLMIEARKYQISHQSVWKPSAEDLALSQALAQELARLYQIPSARSLLEKSQESALLRLAAFEDKTKKRLAQDLK